MKPISIDSIEDWMMERGNFSKLDGCKGHGCTYIQKDHLFGCTNCAVHISASKVRQLLQLGTDDETIKPSVD